MTVIDGINSLRPEAEAKGKVDIVFIVNSPSVLVTWNGPFANLFLLEKIIPRTKKQYFKGKKSILTVARQASVMGDKKKDIKKM